MLSSCVKHVVLFDIVQSGTVSAWRAILLIDTLYDDEMMCDVAAYNVVLCTDRKSVV